MGSGGGLTPLPISISETLLNSYPLYHEVGMSYDEYWHGSSLIFKRYNKLLETQQKRYINKIEFQAWLQGFYVYSAIGTALNGKSYPDKMYGVYQESETVEVVNEKTGRKEVSNDDIEMKRSMALIHQMASAVNRGIDERERKENK